MFILEKSAALWRVVCVAAERGRDKSEDGAMVQARDGWKEAPSRRAGIGGTLFLPVSQGIVHGRTSAVAC